MHKLKAITYECHKQGRVVIGGFPPCWLHLLLLHMLGRVHKVLYRLLLLLLRLGLLLLGGLLLTLGGSLSSTTCRLDELSAKTHEGRQAAHVCVKAFPNKSLGL